MTHSYSKLVPEIRFMRETVAALARAEADNTSYLAFLGQARSLKLMEEKVTAIRYDAEVRARREQLDEPQVCEQYYLEMLSRWLRDHATETRARMHGGEADLVNAERMQPAELAIIRLQAGRHHEMIGDLCMRYVAAISADLELMAADEATYAELRFDLSYGPRP